MSDEPNARTRRVDDQQDPGAGQESKAGGPFSQKDYHHPAAAWGRRRASG
jgi:hypothetical protein